MSKELEALKVFKEMLNISINPNDLHSIYTIKNFIGEKNIEIIKQALERLEAIENADGEKAMKSVEWLVDGCQDWVNYSVIGSNERNKSVEKRKNILLNFIKKSHQQAKELELHRNLFKQLDLTLDIDGYDGNGISKSYEFFEINSEDGSYISNEETIKIIKELKRLLGEDIDKLVGGFDE